jgi:hypothetical protein
MACIEAPRVTLAGDPPVASWQGAETDSIRLAADRIQTWDDAGATWVLLEDQAEVSQGDISIRARSALARVERVGRADGTIHRVELYAEGDVRDPASPQTKYSDLRTRLVTRAEFGLLARVPGGLHHHAKPPRALPIVARAFPDGGLAQVREAAKPVAETSTVQTTPAPPAATPDAGPGSAVMPFGSTPPSPASARVVQNEPKRDDAVRQAQATTPPTPASDDPAFPENFSAQPRPDQDPPRPQGPPGTNPPEIDPLPLAPDSMPLGPGAAPPTFDSPTNLTPIPGAPPRPEPLGPAPDVIALPGTQRVTNVYPRGLGEIQIETYPELPDGTQIFVIRNGVNLQTRSPQQGIVDIEADNVVIWRHKGNKLGEPRIDFNGQFVDNPAEPMEVYLEGHVVFRQDQLIYQGKSDQKTYIADRVYYDFRKDELLAQNAEISLFAPGLVTPIKVKSPRIFQYHPPVTAADGTVAPGTLAAIQAEQTEATGSRFANPGYKFRSKSIDIRQIVSSQEKPEPGLAPFQKDDLTYFIDARQSTFFFGPLPIFYLPRFVAEADDINPPLQGISFATNNYFGQQFRTDFDVFTLLGRRHLPEIDTWNLDVDYLSARDKKPGQGIALGTEIGWYGGDLLNDIRDPFHKQKDTPPSRLTGYSGYFDVYGLFDGSRDVLGGGPAIITNAPPGSGAGKGIYSRISNPTFEDFRYRLTGRHMQSLLEKDAPLDEDFRISIEVGFMQYNDRNFLEQYFKRLFDTGLDQENLIYGIRQKENRTFTFLTETNLQQFNTETQWYPKLDYYRLGDSLLYDKLTYYTHTGVDYANVHTAAEVANPTLFAYLPYDPVSNTNKSFQSGRFSTAHELDLPLNFNFIRVTPYVQGQVVGWNDQISGNAVGRIWGAAGARADVILWKAFPDVESELFNIHGLNHKIDFVADFRDAYSNVPLNSIGVQDDLDDNAYEYTRRYFALTNYVGALLPAQYDPRFLTLRRAISPITGTTDIQASIETVRLGIHQRLQTKRGQEGRRHINDYMVFDLDTTYFPQASRDNFGKPFGQNFYNYEWYIGDRTSIVSYGWFEFWKVTGDPTTVNTSSLAKNDPFGLRIITSGLSITRIPKGNIFIGYTIVDTGPITTSALNASYSYWLSPKWFGTAATSYDFGNNALLGASGSLTRIGADYLTSVGLSVSPLQHSYQFVFEISPRFSPNIRLGSAAGLTRLDTRFAPVE